MRPLKREHLKLIREIECRMNTDATDYADSPSGEYFDSEDATYDLESLFDALEYYAMPYFYFGAHPGDGSDYGYWLSEGFDEDFVNVTANYARGAKASEFPDQIKVNDTSEVPRGYTGEVLHVNDHGNCTLYAYNRGRSREIWAIV
jgi:hypothetical protein